MRQWQKFLIFAGLFLFLVNPNSAYAFGVSPPYIRADRLVPGSRYEATIMLSQGKPDEDLRIKAEFDVPKKVRSWFSVEQGEEFVISAGVQQFPMKVIIQVPQNADLGIFNGYLRVNTIPKEEAGQVVIAVGGRIDINLKIGDEIVADYIIRRIEILDVAEGDPLKVKVTLENTGNVPIGPERATFDLFDKYGDVRLGYSQTEEINEVPSFQTKSFVIKFPLDIKLGLGEYWGEVKLYRGDEVVGQLKTVFDVTERKANFILFGGIGAGLILLIGVGFFLKKKFLRR